MSKANGFPRLPSFKAVWAPVYLEPIMHSGECFTIGIAAIGKDKSVKVVPTINQRQLRCLFGQHGAESFYNMGSLCLEALSDHVSKTKKLTKWKSPLSGITLGEPRQANGESIDDIILIAKRLCACLSSVEKVESNGLLQVGDGLTAGDEWPMEIKEAVQLAAPHLVRNFSQSYEVIEGGRPPRYDYFGARYVANFGKLSPRRLAEGMARARMKLWNLDIVREDSRLLSGITTYEFLLWKPEDNFPLYSETERKNLAEAILELQEEAKKRALSTFPVRTAEEASRHIIHLETAA